MIGTYTQKAAVLDIALRDGTAIYHGGFARTARHLSLLVAALRDSIDLHLDDQDVLYFLLIALVKIIVWLRYDTKVTNKFVPSTEGSALALQHPALTCEL
jgi:hypothetical protein